MAKGGGACRRLSGILFVRPVPGHSSHEGGGWPLLSVVSLYQFRLTKQLSLPSSSTSTRPSQSLSAEHADRFRTLRLQRVPLALYTCQADATSSSSTATSTTSTC
eukprot:178447-Rhodomonas_salina.1